MWQIQRYKIKNKGKIKKLKYYIVVCADTTIGIRASDFLIIFFPYNWQSHKNKFKKNMVKITFFLLFINYTVVSGTYDLVIYNLH